MVFLLVRVDLETALFLLRKVLLFFFQALED